MSDTHFTILDGFPPDVVAIEARGEITGEDYEKTLIPLLESKIAIQGRFRMLYILGEEFTGFTMAAMWDDARFGLTHLSQCKRVALVTDVPWLQTASRFFAPLMPCPFHVFELAARQEAERWIQAGENAVPESPGVRLDRPDR